jgi:hypothetical protein
LSWNFWHVLEFRHFSGFCPGKSNKNTGSAFTANVEKNLRRIGAAMRGGLID